MRRQILISPLILLVVSCTQPESGKKETFRCPDFEFETSQEKADSLLHFFQESIDSEGNLKLHWERKFFCAFPNSFVEMESVFGFDMEHGAAPLYSTGNESGKYIHAHIMSDVIGYFHELESIDHEVYYDKYVRINIDGNWQVDNIGEAFGFHHKLLSDPEGCCSVLSTFTDKEIESVFRFIFDGPHPINSQNERIYHNLLTELKDRDKRLAALLAKSYEKLMAESEGHSH
jgi:hypothetical protein